MRIVVRLFALARQRAGRAEVEVELAEGATVGDLKRALAAKVPDLAPLLPSVLIAVQAEYAPDDQPIPAGADVALIPPVSGGGPGQSIPSQGPTQ